jgi:heptose-I-phosphate ethanolaminephosphotransferase
VLGEIIDRLKKKGGLSWMVYLSDHGETPGKIMRTRSDRNLWEVPMIIWFSDEYKRVHPEVVAAVAAATKCPLQSDQLFQGILRIAGITPASPQEDFTDKRFKPRAQRKINCGKDVYKR